jgi:hypothetical protein
MASFQDYVISTDTGTGYRSPADSLALNIRTKALAYRLTLYSVRCVWTLLLYSTV